ncbi:hypothetical protein D1007_06022 [Hordeum vulgare]|nr:hypothetical protein D1007_06022 [Hordeum vulgare]
MAYPCSDFLMVAGIKDEFDSLSEAAGLAHIVTRRVQQYPKLTYYFVKWFRYNDKTSMIEFRLCEDVLTMSLGAFCDILGVGNIGKMTKMSIHPYELKSLFASLCSKDPREIHRGKISSILFPHIRYLRYYISGRVLARDNMSNVSDPDLAILAAALLGDNTYNIGALVARRLVANSGKGPHFGGIYATLILEHLGRTVCTDDTPFSLISFDLISMKRHEFVTRTSEFGNLVYIMRFGELTTHEICLPAPLLFNYTSRNGWSFTLIELDEFVIQQEFHNPMEEVIPEEEEPSPWEARWASVYAPEASSRPPPMGSLRTPAPDVDVSDASEIEDEGVVESRSDSSAGSQNALESEGTEPSHEYPWPSVADYTDDDETPSFFSGGAFEEDSNRVEEVTSAPLTHGRRQRAGATATDEAAGRKGKGATASRPAPKRPAPGPPAGARAGVV